MVNIKEPPTAERYRITGQVIYMGPQLPHLGLSYSNIFRNGIHPQLYEAIDECPALGALFVPIAQCAAVRRELDFDIARNMRGRTGKHCEFYRAVESWRKMKQQQQPSTGVKLQTHV
jgi:hypothetical protein